jgi:hypothetical protein
MISMINDVVKFDEKRNLRDEIDSLKEVISGKYRELLQEEKVRQRASVVEKYHRKYHLTFLPDKNKQELKVLKTNLEGELNDLQELEKLVG